VIKNNLKKIDISKILSKKKGFSLPLSKKLTQDLINILILMIKNGKLNIKNLGSFKTINKSERLGRNPKTLETFKIKSRKSISFSSSKKISNLINNIYRG
tara:strand:- start:8 stop:307 length:300 start_codon:yes stop_codon:yes gene_type:complete